MAILLMACQPLFAKNVQVEMSDYVVNKLEAKNKKFKSIRKTPSTLGHQKFRIDDVKLPFLSKLVHDYLDRCGGYRLIEENGNGRKYLFDKSFLTKPDYSLNQNDLVQSWFDTIEQPPMIRMITHLSNYHTRYYTSPEGIAAMRWIGQQWIDLTQNRSDIDVQFHKYPDFEQETVILTIQGTENPNNIIILGGHGDSINTDNEGPTSIAPGADDNAAGIAVLTEIIRQITLHQYRPKNTIQFIAYAAEEVGIQGSYKLARIYRSKNKNVIGVMQFDGVNFTGPSYDMALIADNTNQDQNNFVASLIDQYLKVSWKYDYCHYACSDHAAWNYEGYPASYPVETIGNEQNPHIHTPRDTFDKSNFNTDHATIFLKLGISYLIELDQ